MVRVQFAAEGYCIFREAGVMRAVQALKSRFEQDFAGRFNADAEHNRNLIKRFGDGMDVARLFASTELQRLATDVGIKDPVFCGPVVTHYTSHDLTGNSYGLPFHQDWPSMASSANSAIFWLSLSPSGPDTHGLEVVPGGHRDGLLDGTQQANGYVLDRQIFDTSLVLRAEVGEIVVMSPFLPHRTFVNPSFIGWKLSLSRRVDDLQCPSWLERKFSNAYGTSVDRDLYRRWR